MTDRRKIRIAAFGLPVLLVLVIMAIMGQFPFGENSLLIWDMDWQYSAFFAHLHDILHGEASPWYSFSRAIGGDMVGVSAYYLISPFNILFYFFDAEHIYVGIWLVLLLKIGTIGWTMNYYLYQKRQAYSTLIFSTAYALSGFVVGYFFNIIWLDGIMALPLMVLGIEKLVEEGKYLLYVLSIAFAVATSFYIGYMLCAFSVMYFICYYFLISESRKRIKPILLYTISSLLGGALAAWAALPAVYSMQGGKSTMDWAVLKNFTKMFEAREFIGKSFAGMIDDLQMTGGGPLIYCGVLTLLLAAALFFLKGISWKKKAAYGAMLVFLALSLWLYNLCCAWQAFNMPNGSQYRYAFLYTFVMLVAANEAMGALDRETGSLRWKKIVIAGAGIFLLLLLVLARAEFAEINRKGVWAVNAGLVILYTLLFVVNLNKKVRQGAFLVLMSAELCVNGIYLYRHSPLYACTTVPDYKEYVENVSGLVEEVKADEGLFRTVLTGDAYRTVNDSFLWNLYGLDSYTSVERQSTQVIAFDLGYYWNMVFGIHYNEGSTHAAESLLGVKYQITSERPKTGYIEGEKDNGLAIYKNKTVFPPAMFAGEEIFGITNKEYNTFRYQNEIFAGLSDRMDEAVFIPEELVLKDVKNCKENEDGSFSAVNPKREAYVEYELAVKEEGFRYLQYITAETSGVTAVVNGEERNLGEQQNVAKRIGYITPQDTVLIRCYIGGEQPRSLDKVLVYHEKEDVLADYAAEVNTHRIEVTHEKDDEITILCNNEKSDTAYLLLTIPYDAGWKITIDGEKRVADTALENFMVLAVEPGEHTIELQFVPQGLCLGLAVSGAAALLLVAASFCRKRKKSENEEKENQL